MIRPPNPLLDTIRLEAMRRGGLSADAAYDQLGALANMPGRRVRGWINGEYRLTPERLARIARVVSSWLGGDAYPVETMVRLIKASRQSWLDHERNKLVEADGELFQMGLAIYLRRPMPELANVAVEEDAG